MRTGMVLLCLGLATCGWLPALPPLSLVQIRVFGVVCALALSVVYFLPAPASKQRLRLSLCLLLCYLCGLSWSLLHARHFELRRLPASLEGQDIWVGGVVQGLVSAGDDTDRRSSQVRLRVTENCFRLLPEACEQQPDVLIGSRIVLNDYSQLPLQTGEHWWLRVRLNRVHGLQNPGAFDFEAAQAQQGIVARGYIRETRYNQRLKPASLTIDRVRGSLIKQIEQLPELRHAGVLSALVVGDRSGISSTQWDLLSATGTNHLLVISGLHISFVALTAYWLVNLLSRLSVRLLLLCPAQRLGACAALVAAAGYSALAGFSLPTRRALIMVVVALLPLLLARRLAPGFSFLLALSLILLLDPLAASQAGFWLSFSAVAALLLGFTGQLYQPLSTVEPTRVRQASGLLGGHSELLPVLRVGCKRLWQRWVHPQLVVSAGLLVPLLVWTGQFSLLSPIANIVAIPLVSFWVVPLALSGAALLGVWPDTAAWALGLADLGLSVLFTGLGWLTGQFSPVWQASTMQPLAVLCGAAASVLLLLPRGLLPRWPAAILLLPLLWPAPPVRPVAGAFWLQVLDVGQGLAVLIQTNGHTVVFDTGPRSGPDSDTARTAMLPVLQQWGVTRVHTVLVSHWHEDHYGGLQTLLRSVAVQRLLLGGAVPATETLQELAGQSCQAGQQWQLDGVDFQILHPDEQRYRSVNDYSCVLRVSAGGQAVLLTGDIEQAAERALVQRYGSSLRADILMAPHHGSATSSSAALLSLVQPAWLLVSAGYRNRFAHPAPAVLERADAMGIRVLRTDFSGAILFIVGAGEMPELAGEQRRLRRRFWRNIPSDDYGKVAATSAGG